MTEQFRDSQDSLRGVAFNADHHDKELVNAHNEAYYASKAQREARNLKAHAKDSFAAAKDTLVNVKEQVFGAPIKPIEGGMPGRYHPHPEAVEAGLTQRMKDKVSHRSQVSEIEKDSIDQENVGTGTKVGNKMKAGLGSVKSGIISAREQVFGVPVDPIEGGMPGRNHPHPETVEIPEPSLMDKMKDGLVSAQTSIKPALSSAKTSMKTGLRKGKKRVWRKKVQPIEGGMPGRNHPHPERFYHYVGTPALTTTMSRGLSAMQSSARTGFSSAHTGLVSMKNKVFGPKIQPIEGGMPGRNHPHAERFYASTPSLTEKVTEKVKSGWNTAQTSAQHGLASAQTGLVSAKKAVWKEKIVPIEGGMPGRNHPNADRFYAPVASLTEKVQTSLHSAKVAVFGEKIEPIEGGMPGRNHPHAEHLYAQSPSITEKLENGLCSVKVAVYETVFGKIEPIESGMPARNHPHPEAFEHQAPGLLTRIKETFIGADHKTETTPVELQGCSEIDTKNIDQESVKGQLESTLSKETIHPLQGMPGPGRNHPMHESHRADDQGLLADLSDKWKMYNVL